MLERDHKNRLLVGIGKAQYLLLDLDRKLMAKQAIAGGGKIAAVVIELGQNFAQLCFSPVIRRRPYCQPEDLAVISPVEHCRHPVPCELHGCRNRSLRRRHSRQAQDSAGAI
jgi:hypothetical protein